MTFGVEGLTAQAQPALTDGVEVSQQVHRCADGLEIATTRYLPVGVQPSAV
ncbi:MAG: hypothetical protein JWO63_2535, partial [Frankiales bacterium]|nr:hypothetical protein [Frankiales bacterium]